MNIEEMMERNNEIDQVEIGNIVNSALKGNFGNVMKCIIEGMKSEYLVNSEVNSSIPADRTLGRIEALNKLQDRLDYTVEISRQLQEIKKEEDKI